MLLKVAAMKSLKKLSKVQTKLIFKGGYAQTMHALPRHIMMVGAQRDASVIVATLSFSNMVVSIARFFTTHNTTLSFYPQNIVGVRFSTKLFTFPFLGRLFPGRLTNSSFFRTPLSFDFFFGSLRLE